MFLLQGVCGSLTNFFRVKLTAKDNLSYSSEPSYVGQTNYDKDYVQPENHSNLVSINKDTATPMKNEKKSSGDINSALADLNSMKNIQDSGVFSKSAVLDVKKQVTTQVSKLDNLIQQADRAQSSLAHQDKQMRSFLR